MIIINKKNKKATNKLFNKFFFTKAISFIYKASIACFFATIYIWSLFLNYLPS